MNDEIYDQLRRAVVQILGPRPSPERRAQVATDLRALAEQQERLAASVPQSRQAIANARSLEYGDRTPAQPAVGMYVRIKLEADPQTGAQRLRLALGHQIWIELGSPERVDVQPAGAECWIVPTTDRAGYALSTSMGQPSCVIAGATPLSRLLPGRYAATIHAGAIVIGARVA